MLKKNRKTTNHVINWDEIFVPYGFPKRTFVDGQYKENIEDIRTSLASPTDLRIICVQGPSQSGKTMLVEYILRNQDDLIPIKIPCAGVKNQDDFVKKLKEQLELVDTTQERGWSVNSINAWYGHKKTSNDSITDSDILKHLNKKVVIIDDFHFIPSEGQSEILEWIKNKVENPAVMQNKIKVKFILILIPNKPSIDPRVKKELDSTRINNIKLTLWKPEYLIRIAQTYIHDETGNVLLGLNEMAEAAYGLPSMMQLLCLNYCNRFYKNARSDTTIYVRENELLEVMQRTAERNWSSPTYNQLVGQDMINRVNIPNVSTKDNIFRGSIYQMIWYAISTPNLNKKDKLELPKLIFNQGIEVPLSDIKKRLAILTGQEFSINDLRIYMRNLTTDAEENYRKYTIQNTQNSPAKKFDPLFELDGDRLIIHSPQILFELSYAKSHIDKLKE
jgi:hypothetical protein